MNRAHGSARRAIRKYLYGWLIDMNVKHAMICRYCGIEISMNLEKETRSYDCGKCYATTVFWGRCYECGTTYQLEARNSYEVDES